jgi:hypothetical protein
MLIRASQPSLQYVPEDTNRQVCPSPVYTNSLDYVCTWCYSSQPLSFTCMSWTRKSLFRESVTILSLHWNILCVCHMFEATSVAYLASLRRNLTSCGHSCVLDMLAVNRAGLEFRDRHFMDGMYGVMRNSRDLFIALVMSLKDGAE